MGLRVAWRGGGTWPWWVRSSLNILACGSRLLLHTAFFCGFFFPRPVFFFFLLSPCFHFFPSFPFFSVRASRTTRLVPNSGHHRRGCPSAPAPYDGGRFRPSQDPVAPPVPQTPSQPNRRARRPPARARARPATPTTPPSRVDPALLGGLPERTPARPPARPPACPQRPAHPGVPRAPSECPRAPWVPTSRAHSLACPGLLLGAGRAASPDRSPPLARPRGRPTGLRIPRHSAGSCAHLWSHGAVTLMLEERSTWMPCNLPGKCNRQQHKSQSKEGHATTENHASADAQLAGPPTTIAHVVTHRAVRPVCERRRCARFTSTAKGFEVKGKVVCRSARPRG